MKQLLLCGIGITALFLMSCNGTNFTGSNDGTTATVTTNAVSTTSSTVLTTDLCNGTTTDFATVQSALLTQLQYLINDYTASSTTTVSGTYNYNRYSQACRQIVSAQQIVASATGFTQDFNSVLSYVCNKLYGTTSSYQSDNGYYGQQGEYSDQQQRGQQRPPPPQQQGFGDGNNQQQRPPPQGPPPGFQQGQMLNGQFQQQQYQNDQFQNSQYNYQGY